MQVDYLIVGQGIAGTLISYELMKAGKSVIVIDKPQDIQASRIAGGIINPFVIKGRSSGELLRENVSAAIEIYRDLEKILETSLLHNKPLICFHETESEAFEFRKRLKQKNDLPLPDTVVNEQLIRNQFKPGAIWNVLSPVWQLELRKLLDGWRHMLLNKGMLLEEFFKYGDCQYHETYWQYRDISAGSIIFCEGTGINDNPFIKEPILIPNRGDVLLISIPGLDPQYIYEKKYRLLHWSDDVFWCGTSHQWNYTELSPDEYWRKEVEKELRQWLNSSYQVIDHRVAERPATAGQRIITGSVLNHPSAYIFNGLGTRGVINGPAAARKLCRFLIHT